MAVEWRELPSPGPGWPFDDRWVLLLIANTVFTPWHAGGRRLDPAQPWYAFVGYWDRDLKMWATTETDDETNRTRFLQLNEPTHWAEINFPSYQPSRAI